MSGLENKPGLDEPVCDDGFLRGIPASGRVWLGSENGKSHDPRLYRIVCKLRDRGPAWLWCCLSAVARFIPRFVFDWANYGMDSRAIWDEEITRSGGPSDTGVIRYSRRVDEEVGFRILSFLIPVWVLVLLMVLLFSMLPAEAKPSVEKAQPHKTSIVIHAINLAGRK